MPDFEDDSDRLQLKDAVRSIILTQGNAFIKELLHKHKIQIGTKKADFAKNLLGAIDAGTLTRPMIEDWLSEVDGWGNQHIYLFQPPRLAVTKVKTKLKGSKFRNMSERQSATRFRKS